MRLPGQTQHPAHHSRHSGSPSVLGNLAVVLSVLSSHLDGLLTELPAFTVVALFEVHGCQAGGSRKSQSSPPPGPPNNSRARGLGLTCLVGHVSHVGGVQVLGSVVVFQGRVKVLLLIGFVPQLLLFQGLDEGRKTGALSTPHPDGRAREPLASQCHTARGSTESTEAGSPCPACSRPASERFQTVKSQLLGREVRVSPLLPLRLALFHLSLHLPEMSASSGERKSLQPEIPSERTVQLCARSCSEAQQVWVVMCCLWVSAVRDSSRGGRRGAGGLSWWQESSAERTTTHIVRRAFFQP